MQDINGYERFIGLLPGCYSMGVSHPETFVAGANLVLNSAEAPLTALTLYGKSTQDTTTGAQLLNTQELKPNTLKCEFAVSGDGYIIQINATVPDDNEGRLYLFLQFGLPDSYAGKTLTANYEAYETTLDDERYDLGYVFTQADGTKGYISHERKSGKVFTTTIPEDVTNIFLRLFLTESTSGSLTPGETLSAAFTGLTLCEGSSALPWEPYTGGAPSPSPDYPQEIHSAGDSGTINITLSDSGSQSQTLPVSTPGGLPGIPVDSGGNYTDESGQQWVCDEVDYKRGKYVKRIGIDNLRDCVWDETWNNNPSFYIDGTFLVFTQKFNDVTLFNIWKMSICTHFRMLQKSIFLNPDTGMESGRGGNFNIAFRIPSTLANSISEWEQWLQENDVVFTYILATPIETDLPAEEIAAYAALRTYSPTTVVSNDAGAWMKVGYYGLTTIQKLEKEALLINGGKT